MAEYGGPEKDPGEDFTDDGRLADQPRSGSQQPGQCQHDDEIKQENVDAEQ
ncbi:hypothetical protein [Actinomadura madurae]|uniref:hypothetical protein n=1 Tax=Actinomadura madurae TaxID=1993 RepID=UPI0020D20A21|nr:hypothetical protein [Actinomadura madurae]MCP9949089.1 hypothetical protein [Actinomadura madurae]MCP9965850.1 hypothetical protein [Actinomadura madurae]MCP9978329.1 hypothetical protein [Actinomadura madurae]MCQ0014537.1 hypothetical protein [Actinomadura madurae]